MTVYEAVHKCGFPTDVGLVGRLDKETSGLMVLTDDAVLNRALTQPDNSDDDDLEQDGKKGLAVQNVFKEKVYQLILVGEKLFDSEYVNSLAEQMSLPFTFNRFGEAFSTSAANVTLISYWHNENLSFGQDNLGWCVELCVRLYEGKHHQIRRMVKRCRGLHVLKLCRTEIANGLLHIDTIPEPGTCRWISDEEVRQLYEGLKIHRTYLNESDR